MDAQERPFSLVFLWAYKEKVTRQQAKPQTDNNNDIEYCHIGIADNPL